MKTLREVTNFLSELCNFKYKIFLMDNNEQLIECEDIDITDYLKYEVLEINNIAIQPSSSSFNPFNSFRFSYPEPDTSVFIFIKLNTIFS